MELRQVAKGRVSTVVRVVSMYVGMYVSMHVCMCVCIVRYVRESVCVYV